MIVRSLDDSGDWTFGKGRNNYLVDNKAIMQSIATRLRSFLGDCFFAPAAGLDWFNLLGAKDKIALELGVRTTILNTAGVKSIVSVNIALDETTRLITMSYTVTTVFTEQTASGPLGASTGLLLTESGNVLTTEDGEGLGLG